MARLNLENSDPEKDFNDKLKSIIQADTGADDQAETENDVAADADDDDEEGLHEIDVDDEDLEEEVEEPVATAPVRKVTKEQAAIISLKKQIKELKDIVTVKADQERQAVVSKQKESLIQEYVDNGYDEDQAKRLAEKDLKILAIEQKVERNNFKMSNTKLLDKYPQAEAEIDRIMSIMETSKLSAEQVCVALYHTPEVDKRERAKAAVTGQLPKSGSANSISSATRTATAPVETSLSQADRRKKAEFEQWFGTVSNERFLELKEKYPM